MDAQELRAQEQRVKEVRVREVPARERGMVTAELALAMPALVLVLAFALGALGLAIDEVRCVDAAGAGARAAARGDPPPAVTAVAARAAPAGASVLVSGTGGAVTVSVRAPGGMWSVLLPSGLRPQALATLPREEAPEDPGQAGATDPPPS